MFSRHQTPSESGLTWAYLKIAQVAHNVANFYVEAFDRYGNVVFGKVGQHLPLKVGRTVYRDWDISAYN